jgi:23S rRNA (cytosine1962-C5)-methyltransferase
LLFEDDHLLVVNKPAGLNTHSPSPYAGEGLYDWLRHREPCWAKLAIIHRLDKETSGFLLFAKTQAANRSLTEQFTKRSVHKKYALLTDRSEPKHDITVRSAITRAGNKYVSRPLNAGADQAETRFFVGQCQKSKIKNQKLIEAEPLTGRTHQIRVHAAEAGFPILGDTLYGGTPAPRVCLHAAELVVRHPVSQQRLTFRAPVDFEADTRLALRMALLDSEETNAFRIIHGMSDGWPGWYVEKLGDYLLSESVSGSSKPGSLLKNMPPEGTENAELEKLVKRFTIRGVYHKALRRQVAQTTPEDSSPRLLFGEPAPERFLIQENGLQFELSFNEGYSVGLFLDQRDNRRRLLTGHIAADFKVPQQDRPREVLNTFAYTCGFSACAAKSGARTTNLDLSKKYLDWGRRNFELNGLDPTAHDFIFGDVFEWLRRFGKKDRKFDLILLDPPTFSRSKESGVFQVEKDYPKLVEAALAVLKPGGILFASTNSAVWPPQGFVSAIKTPIHAARRKTLNEHYFPQPPDFPVSSNELAYLKTIWLQLE